MFFMYKQLGIVILVLMDYSLYELSAKLKISKEQPKDPPVILNVPAC